jgi:hypothetical protein
MGDQGEKNRADKRNIRDKRKRVKLREKMIGQEGKMIDLGEKTTDLGEKTIDPKDKLIDRGERITDIKKTTFTMKKTLCLKVDQEIQTIFIVKATEKIIKGQRHLTILRIKFKDLQLNIDLEEMSPLKSQPFSISSVSLLKTILLAKSKGCRTTAISLLKRPRKRDPSQERLFQENIFQI